MNLKHHGTYFNYISLNYCEIPVYWLPILEKWYDLNWGTVPENWYLIGVTLYRTTFHIEFSGLLD